MNSETLTELNRLVDTYNASKSTFERATGGYQESEARSEFIDPFLELLGWDVSNRAGLIFSAREVLREESQRAEKNACKKPDYTMRVAGQKKFFIEAKKPSVDILTHKPSIFQARSYGYTAGHPIVVLINFRNISIFDTTAMPNENDAVDAYRLFWCSVDEIAEKFHRLEKLVGKKSVSDYEWYGEFSSFDPGQQSPVSKFLIERISKWKIQIAADVLSRNAKMNPETLEFLVQKLINRLLFVRMCEDRGIEGEKFLIDETSVNDFDVLEFFKKLDDRYNSGLFNRSHLAAEPSVLVSSQLVRSIVENLYAPYSPFSFSVLGAEILGLVYEYALTQHLVIDTSSIKDPIRLEKKEEYLRRDVVVTPQELVDKAVARGFSFLTAPEPKILDFAIGSGRFLISAFNHYMNVLVEQRLNDPNSGSLEKVGEDRWKLPFLEKSYLLSHCFFGIDIDSNAVEVAKFSLLVNLLEDENDSTLPRGQRILPNLDQNIVHGNTLVSSLPGASDATLLRTVPFERAESDMPPKFDFIIGNPPYMKTEDMKKFNDEEFRYLRQEYRFSHKQFDKYMPFIEYALDNLSESGVSALIVPNKWLTNGSGEPIRKYLLTNQKLLEISNFKHVRVFEDKDIYICSLFLGKNVSGQIQYSEPKSFSEYVTSSGSTQILTSADFVRFSTDTWILPANKKEAQVLDRLALSSIKIGDVVDVKTGIQTSNNDIYVISKNEVIKDGTKNIKFVKDGKTYSIEKSILKPYLDDSRSVMSDHFVVSDSFIIYPYETTSNTRNTSGFKLIPVRKMKTSFPLAYKYLNEFKVDLRRRNLGRRSSPLPFYGFGRVQAVGTAPNAPKIFYSVNQRGDKYGLDESGVVYSSGGTAGEVAMYPKGSDYSLDFILGLLDQSPIEFFLRKSGSPFQGGYYSRGAAVIKEVPIPKLNFAVVSDKKFHDEISLLTVNIRSSTAGLQSASPAHLSTIQRSIASLKKTRSQLFLNRWGLTPSDIKDLLET